MACVCNLAGSVPKVEDELESGRRRGKVKIQAEDGKSPNSVHTPIYLDNHATTPVDPRVLEEMLPYFREKFGNPASRNHSFGWNAGKAVEKAREQVAKLIGANVKEVVFTSGATESDNLAIKGVAHARNDKGDHIITAVTEHRAVLDSCKRLEQEGFRVTYLPVRKDGLVDLEDLRRAINDKTVLVTIMAANNEIGVLHPWGEIGKLCHKSGVIFHTDAAQATGKVPLDVVKDDVDLVSISGHKMYGPKGIGALYVRDGIRVEPNIDGGGHEHGMRSGTLNVPGIVGLGKACEIAQEEMTAEPKRISALRDRLRDRILQGVDEVHINGSLEHRLAGNLNISFENVDGESLMLGLSDIAVSSSSACRTASLQASHVLRSLGVSDDLAHSTIRFGVGRFSTEAEIDYAAGKVIEVVSSLRELSRV